LTHRTDRASDFQGDFVNESLVPTWDTAPLAIRAAAVLCRLVALFALLLAAGLPLLLNFTGVSKVAIGILAGEVVACLAISGLWALVARGLIRGRRGAWLVGTAITLMSIAGAATGDTPYGRIIGLMFTLALLAVLALPESRRWCSR
jgi:hypothetical protein